VHRSAVATFGGMWLRSGICNWRINFNDVMIESGCMASRVFTTLLR